MAEIHTPWARPQHGAGSHSCTNTRHVPMGPNSPHSHFSHVCVVIFPLILQEKGKSTLKQALLFVMAYFKRDFPAWRSLKPCSQHRSPPMCFFSCIQRVLQSSRTSWMAVPALQANLNVPAGSCYGHPCEQCLVHSCCRRPTVHPNGTSASPWPTSTAPWPTPGSAQ